MLYIPTSSLEIAQETSRKFYQLCRPPQVCDREDVTEFYCSWLVHPTTNQVVLCLPEDDTLLINKLADETSFNFLFEDLIEDGVIPPSVAENTELAIAYNKGNSINVLDYLPTFWKQQALTYEDLINKNWFPVEEEASNA